MARGTYRVAKRGATAEAVKVTSAELAEKLNQMVSPEQWELEEVDGEPGFVVNGSFLPLDWEASNKLAKKRLRIDLKTATQWNELEVRWLVAGGCAVVLSGDHWEPAE